MKKSQKQWVIDQLQTYGEVTRNQALQHFISRLGAIVLVLKNEGYDLIAEQRGSDYVYKLAHTITPKVTKTPVVIINGQRVAVNEL